MNRLVNGDPFYGSNEYGGGSMGVKKMSDTHIHVIYGPAVENIATQLHAALKM